MCLSMYFFLRAHYLVRLLSAIFFLSGIFSPSTSRMLSSAFTMLWKCWATKAFYKLHEKLGQPEQNTTHTHTQSSQNMHFPTNTRPNTRCWLRVNLKQHRKWKRNKHKSLIGIFSVVYVRSEIRQFSDAVSIRFVEVFSATCPVQEKKEDPNFGQR